MVHTAESVSTSEAKQKPANQSKALTDPACAHVVISRRTPPKDVSCTMARSRSLSLALALALSLHHAAAFSPAAPSSNAARGASALRMSPADGDCALQERRAVLSSLLTVTSATLAGAPAFAGLLDDYGADPNVNKQPEKKKEQAVNKGKKESNMEPNLRSNYYYPTNKGAYGV